MDRERCLREYAELVVRMGVNIQKEQILVINSPIECAEFARIISCAAFRAEAHDVVMNWGDEESQLIRYKEGKDEIFSEFPEWRKKFYTDYAEKGAAFVSIAARNPEIFKEVSGERIMLEERTVSAALFEYRERLMSNKNPWCVVSVPTKGWAMKVFPELNEIDAVNALWDAIFKMMRIGEDGNVLDKWKHHTKRLKDTVDYLNREKFTSLHYKNSLGTDLNIELPEGHIWAGGAENTQGGVSFVANMPTEEVYTMPKRDGVNGTVVATKPLVYRGKLISDFRVTFEKGKVVSFSAGQGEEVLKSLFSVDEGASYLGEVALVPHDSPISNSGILFYNTLFDENASCHLAFGKAYPTCIEGGEDMLSVERLKRGVNDSAAHEDFMIGSSDLNIVGTKADGSRVQIFKNGNFAF